MDENDKEEFSDTNGHQEGRQIEWLFMSTIKKSTARNTLQFSRDKERHKQTFFKCIRHEKRLKKKSVHLSIGGGKLITDDTEKQRF